MLILGKNRTRNMQGSKILLCIGFVYPEPKSSAAGTRILQLLKCFTEANYKVVFGTTARRTPHSQNLEAFGIEAVELQLNNASFDVFISKLNPAVVLFDRFMTEEQFGWRVAKYCPNALRILDTEDLHFLRKARAKNLDSKMYFSKAFLKSDIASREIASIYRCDLSLIISEVELDILTQEVGIPLNLLIYIPFIFEFSKHEKSLAHQASFEARNDFVFIGNFLHRPNLQAVTHLKTHIWPLIHKKLAEAKLYIYGAYAKSEHFSLQNESQNFFISGRTDDLGLVLKSHRMLLAPIQFGAGLKGKVVEAMRYGIPCGLSSIAAEGVFGRHSSNGFIDDEVLSFAAKAVQLYSNKGDWQKAQTNGFKVFEKRFSRSEFEGPFLKTIDGLMENIDTHRLNNVTGMLLLHHSQQSTKYLSKWIAAKNKTD